MPDYQPFTCVILAAGEGKRMKSRLPKVAHRLAGETLINHVLGSVEKLSPIRIVVVVPGADKIIGRMVAGKARTVVQDEKLGTGHALLQARSLLSDFRGDILVLSGDVPLITARTLKRLLSFHQDKRRAATILTARLKDPTGYGRIVRKGNGEVDRIVEETEADLYQKVLEEINTGIYCFRSPEIWPVLERIRNDNRQGEYYLTDVIHLMLNRTPAPETFTVEDPRQIWGVNSRWQLAVAEKIFQEITIRDFQDRGVTVVRPELTYIEAGVEIGRETIIYPFTFIGKGSRLGETCRVGPFVHIAAGEVIPDNTEVTTNITVERLRCSKR